MAGLYSIYRNLHKFAVYRQMDVTSRLLPEEAFLREIDLKQHVLIEARRIKDSAIVSIVLIADDEKFAKKVKDVKSLIMRVTMNDNNPVERLLILISKTDITGQIAKVLDVTNATVLNYTYDNFIVEKPKALPGLMHQIASHEEKKALMDDYVDLKNLPKIYVDDTQCIWIGAEVGDVVRINRDSINVGRSTEYRIVVKRIITDTEDD